MANAGMLEKVKSALGIDGEYQDATISEYIDEVTAFLIDAGIPESRITAGIVSRGVSDLWSYGAGNGKLSSYFMQRAAQLSYKGGGSNG